MTDAAAWFAARTRGAPPELAARALACLAEVPAEVAMPARLAAAAQVALDGVLRQAPDRLAALDLLTADSLVTLALLAQAEEEPSGLSRFAECIVSPAST